MSEADRNRANILAEAIRVTSQRDCEQLDAERAKEMNKPNMEPAGINDDPMAAERELRLAELRESTEAATVTDAEIEMAKKHGWRYWYDKYQELLDYYVENVRASRSRTGAECVCSQEPCVCGGASLTRQALDEGYQAVESALGPDGVRALVEERNTAQARVKELEKELAQWEESQASVERAQQRRDIEVMKSVRLPLEARIAELQAQLVKANAGTAEKIVHDEAVKLYAETEGENAVLRVRAEKAEARGEALAKELADFKRWIDKESAFLSKDDLVATLVERAEAAEARAATLLPVTEASLTYFEAVEKGASLSEQQRLWLLWDCAVIKYRAAIAKAKEGK